MIIQKVGPWFCRCFQVGSKREAGSGISGGFSSFVPALNEVAGKKYRKMLVRSKFRFSKKIQAKKLILHTTLYEMKKGRFFTNKSAPFMSKSFQTQGF